MNLRSFSSCALLGTLLAPWILGGNPALADKPSSKPSSVNVCVQREAQTPCFKVSENDPELITLMKRYEPDVSKDIPYALYKGTLGAWVLISFVWLILCALMLIYFIQKSRRKDT